MENNQRLIIVTREDLSAGYQIAQSIHATAEFAYHFPIEFKQWRENGNYVVALAVPDEAALKLFVSNCGAVGLKYIPFKEGDINELTSVALVPDTLANTVTKYFPLAGRVIGDIDKHNNALHSLPSAKANN